MPVGMTVAVITQILRINACIDFINSSGDAEVTIFTGDPGAFKDADLPGGTSVLSASSPDLLLPDPSRLRRVGRRRLLEWMRSGSRIGRLAERAARKLMRVVRPVEDSNSYGVAPNHPTNTFLVTELEKLHRTTPISTIAVFDVFDLPSVLEFAEEAGVRVIVR